MNVNTQLSTFAWFLFIMLYKVVLNFLPVNKALVCDHSNESYIGQYSVQGGSIFKFENKIVGCDHSHARTFFFAGGGGGKHLLFFLTLQSLDDVLLKKRNWH